MSTWNLASSICTARGCQLVYRSADNLIGLHITSSAGRTDRRRYFVWNRPDSAPEYDSEDAARTALATPQAGVRR